jgi:hypothetical protein
MENIPDTYKLRFAKLILVYGYTLKDTFIWISIYVEYIYAHDEAWG